ncbi:hypothetical protein IKD98_02940 [Candidatus Saccharibacteria bacterium]|nr:hypothetical protein [Candidatus Saccharibacteria bacterium]
MQLIVILLTTVSVLTFLSGAIVFFGSTKKDRARSAWYFLAAIFATIWMASISFFLIASPSRINSIGWHVNWTFISAIILDIGFLGYGAWTKKRGKIVTLIFLLLGLIVSAAILINPGDLYSAVTLSPTGNTVTMNIAPLYFAYIGFFCLIVPAIIAVFFSQFLKTRSNRKRGGDFLTMSSFGLSSTLVMIFNLILPLFGNWSLIWIGPLSLAVTIISVYYTILRYKMLNLSSIWLRVFSYVIVIASLAIIYMVLFSIVFAALFRGSTPSTEVIVLNFIMILIFISLIPAMSSSLNYIKYLISGQKKTNEEQ